MDARSRLLQAALLLFAEKGYQLASTREICKAADANISAIKYYFGDKAGLYREVFNLCQGDMPDCSDVSRYLQLPLRAGLHAIFKDFLAALKQGEQLRLIMKLHYREMLEPTGMWQQQIETKIKPQHLAVITMLQAGFGLSQPDDDMHLLAFSLIGMAVHFYVGQDVIAAVCPNMTADADAIDLLAERLADYGFAMVQGEAIRRGLQLCAN